MKGSKTTISPVFAMGKASPSATRHPMISFSGSTPSFTIRRRCSSVTVDLCHTRFGGGISAIGEKPGGIRARSKLPKQQKTPNRAAALEAGKAAEDERRKMEKVAAAQDGKSCGGAKNLIAGG